MKPDTATRPATEYPCCQELGTMCPQHVQQTENDAFLLQFKMIRPGKNALSVHGGA